MNLLIDNKLKINKLIFLSLLATFFLFGGNSFAQIDGKALFKQNCAACHHPLKDMTGPALKGVKAKWEDAGDDINAWVKNSKSQIDAGVKSALAIKDYSPTEMPGQAVGDEEIDAIFEYVESVKERTTPTPTTPSGGGDSASTGNSSTWLWWLIIGFILLIIIVALWGVRR